MAHFLAANSPKGVSDWLSTSDEAPQPSLPTGSKTIQKLHMPGLSAMPRNSDILPIGSSGRSTSIQSSEIQCKSEIAQLTSRNTAIERSIGMLERQNEQLRSMNKELQNELANVEGIKKLRNFQATDAFGSLPVAEGRHTPEQFRATHDMAHIGFSLEESHFRELVARKQELAAAVATNLIKFNDLNVEQQQINESNQQLRSKLSDALNLPKVTGQDRSRAPLGTFGTNANSFDKASNTFQKLNFNTRPENSPVAHQRVPTEFMQQSISAAQNNALNISPAHLPASSITDRQYYFAGTRGEAFEYISQHPGDFLIRLATSGTEYVVTYKGAKQIEGMICARVNSDGSVADEGIDQAIAFVLSKGLKPYSREQANEANGMPR